GKICHVGTQQQAIFEIWIHAITFLTSIAIVVFQHFLLAVWGWARLIEAVVLLQVDNGGDSTEVVRLVVESKTFVLDLRKDFVNR
ncbi:MAG: hypothetical protein AAF515_17195, partial [Pseudomonadota bacterium]